MAFAYCNSIYNCYSLVVTQKYYLEGVDDALDFSNVGVKITEPGGNTNWYYYSGNESSFSFEYNTDSIQNEDGTLKWTGSSVPVIVKYNGKEAGSFDVQILSVEKDYLDISIADYNLKKTQFFSESGLDYASNQSFLEACFSYGGENVYWIRSDDAKWSKAGLSVNCIWPSGSTDPGRMEVGETSLIIKWNGEDVKRVTVDVIESLAAVTKRTFDTMGSDAKYKIDVIPYESSVREYYKLEIPEDGEYWFYGRSSSWFNVNAVLWDATLTSRETQINLYQGANSYFLQDEEGYYREYNDTELKKGTYYLIVETCNTSEGNPVDFYYQKAGVIKDVSVSGVDQVQKEFMVGTSSLSNLDFSGLRWTFTYEDGKKEIMEGAGSYYWNYTPWTGVYWTCAEKNSSDDWNTVLDKKESITIISSYFVEGEQRESVSFKVELKSFADMVTSYRVTLSDVKTEYVYGLESQLDTNGIRVSYKLKNQTYGDCDGI